MTAGSVDLIRDGKNVVVTMRGEVDLNVAPAVMPRVAQVQPDDRVIVDMADVTFFDSTGIGLLVALHNTTGLVRLIGASETIEKLLVITGLAGVFIIDAGGQRKAS